MDQLTNFGVFVMAVTFIVSGALWGLAMGACLVLAVQHFCDRFGCKCNNAALQK